MADTLKTEIEAGNKKFMDAFANKDAKAIGDLYTEDCTIMPPGAAAGKGRDAVAAVFSGMMEKGATSLKLEVDEVGGVDTITSFERSRFTFTDKDGKVMAQGKYVVIWKKINSTMYLYIDIFNTNS